MGNLSRISCADCSTQRRGDAETQRQRLTVLISAICERKNKFLMNKNEIITALTEEHKIFSDYLNSLNDKEFLFIPTQKWSAGQQLDHICRSVKPLAQGLLLPKFLIHFLFGKANRNSKTNQELIKKYLDKLESGGRASGRFIPKEVGLADRQRLTATLSRSIRSLTRLLYNYSEEDLDKIILPHPLLGKLTLREMLYFTIYHVQHHLNIMRRNLEMP